MKKIKEITIEEKIAQEIERERVTRALESYRKAGHGTPITRRQLLGAGVTSSIAMLTAPSLAMAASQMSPECKMMLEPTDKLMPFVHVHLGGGGALAGNVLMLDKNRQPLEKYGRLGLGDFANLSITKEFGKVPMPRQNGELVGKIIDGILTAAGTASAKTAFLSVAVRSQDDSISDPFSMVGLVNAAGLRGIDLPNLTFGGAAKRYSAFLKPSAPQYVNSIDVIKNFLSPSGVLKTLYPDAPQRDGLLKMVHDLSVLQKAKFAGSESGKTLGQLVDCSTAKNIDLANQDASTLDPRSNPAVAAVWGIDTTTNAASVVAVQAAVAMSALTGRGGPATIGLGGFDYHGQMRADTNERDRLGGELIGRILKTAEVLKTPVFIHVTSDGAVESASSAFADVNFGADAGTRAACYVLCYHPAGRPETNDTQIGQFTPAQAVDEAFINTWNVPRATLAVFANYLQVQGKISLLNKLVPNEFDASILSKVVKFT